MVYIVDIDISTTEVYYRADTEMKRLLLEKANYVEQPLILAWIDDTELLL